MGKQYKIVERLITLSFWEMMEKWSKASLLHGKETV